MIDGGLSGTAREGVSFRSGCRAFESEESELCCG